VDGHVDGVDEKPTCWSPEIGPDERLLSVRQVAERLSVSRATVYSLVSIGALPHLRVSNAIRVRDASLESYLLAGAAKAHRGP
jgi:excisionase family DNA binding protein